MTKNVLCIDDIQTNLFTLKSVLEVSVEDHYNVFTAQSAHDGLEILLKEKIDIILLDVMMPGIDGYEAAKIIKSSKKTKDIPIIFVTAKKDDEAISMCYEVGGDDYINKPFNYIELLSRVRFHIQLKDKSKLLIKEKEFTQNILDLQDNFIIVTDSHQAISVNKALLNFFELENLYEFQSKCGCLAEKFVEEEGYFSVNKNDDRFLWIEELQAKLDTDDIVVKIIKDEDEYIFSIKVNSYYDYFIITLADVTSITQQSLEYQHEANYDALTQIYNRNMFNSLIHEKIKLAKLQKNSFTFVILDIDFFKKVNDTYGHLVGDDILRNLVKLIQKHIRDNDLFARWGGEEFVLAFDINIDRGMQISESLRKHIETNFFDVVGHITCSFGVTEFKTTDTLESMTKRADEALYEAKKSGRNRVCLT